MILNYQDLDKKKKERKKNNEPLETEAGRQRFQLRTSHTSVLPSFSRKRQFQDSVTNQLLFTGSEEPSQAELPLKTLRGPRRNRSNQAPTKDHGAN